MGVMQRMRSMAPAFILGVGGLFVLFMVLSDSNLSQIVGQRSNVVGVINGDDVTYQEFTQTVEQYRAQQVQQTGREISEDQMGFFRDQVWDAIVSQKLIQDKIEELGIQVTDEEIQDVILGPNPPAFLTQNFMDSTGQFNRAAYDNALMDPNNKQAVIQAEEFVRQQKIQEKLRSYVNASVIISQSDLFNTYIDRNVTMTAQFASVKGTQIPDKDIEVTDADVKKYYDENLDMFKLDATRKLKYILFRKAASTEDTNNIRKNFNSIMKKLKADTSAFKTFVEIYSTQPYSMDTLSITQIAAEAQTAVSDAKDGEIVGPMLTRRGFVIYRKIDEVKADEQFVRASHILVKTSEGNDKEAKEKADQIYAQLRSGADFETLAQKVSEDGSAKKGGDLGWFGKGQMVAEFEKAAFNGRIGRIQKPVKTNFGYHIIKTTGKSKNKYVVEQIIKPIDPSPSTIDNIYNKANDFVFLADKYGWDKTVEDENLVALETNGFKEDTRSIPGIGQNTSLLKWTYENSVGEISKVYKVNSGYVVAMVSEINKPGFKDFETVKSICRMNFLRDQKKEKAFEIAKQIKEKIEQTGNFEDAKSVFKNAAVEVAENFKRNGSIPKVGRDFAFADFALNTELNKVVGPVKGSTGSYVLKVTERTPVDTAKFEMQKNLLRDQMLQRQKSNYFQRWVENLKEDAEIEDNRYNFFR